MTYLVHVTQADIDKGGPKTSNCPIALALRRQVRGWGNATVGCATMGIPGRRIDIPKAVNRWRTKYDLSYFGYYRRGGKDIGPFSFEIEVN